MCRDGLVNTIVCGLYRGPGRALRPSNGLVTSRHTLSGKERMDQSDQGFAIANIYHLRVVPALSDGGYICLGMKE